MENKLILKILTSSITILLVVLLAFAAATFFMGQTLLAIIEFGIWVILAVYMLLRATRAEQGIEEYMVRLSSKLDETTKNHLLKFPLPLVVLQKEGNIIWYNHDFQEIFKGEKLFNRALSDIVEDTVDVRKIMQERDRSDFYINCRDQYFKVLTNELSIDPEGGQMVLYFIDETTSMQLKKMYEDSRIVTATIIVDNYDEVMQNTEQQLIPILQASIEREITRWADQAQGILKKIARDRYAWVFEHKYLQIYLDGQFKILETLKSIQEGNKIPVTASIGIGIQGKSLEESDTYAKSAIDMALGRGGDQVVVKDGIKFAYYGGNTMETEKHTRVKTRVMAGALRQLIAQSEKVMIMGHARADFDSIGAAMGLYSAILGVGKEVKIVLEDPNASCQVMLDRLKTDKLYAKAFINNHQATVSMTKGTLLVVVDVFRPSITQCPALLEKTDNIVVIDHHRKSEEFIQHTTLTYHEPYASSACEMVTELLQYMDDGKYLEKTGAQALYAGMVMDTKNFGVKTGVRTFEVAAYLRKKGVDTIQVKQLFQTDFAVYEIKSDIIKSAKIYKNIFAIAKNEKNNTSDILSTVATAADELLGVSGVEASFVVSTWQGGAYISGRSLGGVNVQFILEKIGGGGHMTVAGAQLDCDVKQAENQLKNAIDEFLSGRK